MASRIGKSSLLQIHRQFAAQAAPASIKKGLAVEGIETSTLPNGLTVASLNPPSAAVTSLGIVVKAGSRFESHENLGAAHAMRIAAGLATKNSTSFAVVRNIQQVGAGLNCSQSREHLTYTTQITRDKVDAAIDFFLDTFAQPSFKPWELSDNSCRLAMEVADRSDAVIAAEFLHKVAYRTGLGNSIFSPVHMIGKHKPNMLQAFHAKNFTGARTVLVGVGIEHSHLVKYGELLKLEKGSNADAPTKYFGGEHRCERGGKQAVVLLATESSGLSSPREAVANLLLQKILGVGSRVPYGSGAGQMQKALAGKVDGPFAVSGLNYSYADSGLIGAFIVSEASIAGKVVETVAATLRTASVSEAELSAAKKALTIDIFESGLSPVEQLTDIGATALLRGGNPLTDGDKIDLITKATLADVQAAAKKLSAGKMSMSSVGNLVTVPYLDAL